MRLIINAPYDTRCNDGISLYLRRVATELARLSPVTVLTPYADTISADCRIVTIPRWSTSRTGGLVWTAGILPFRGIEGDVLLSITPVTPPIAGMPTISIVHDLTPLVLAATFSAGTKLALWASLRTLRYATAVVAVSENTKRDLVRMRIVPEERISVVYEGPGVEPRSSAGGFGAGYSPFLLYVGGYGQNKNVSRLLEAFARLRTGGHTKLVMVGWGTPSLLARTISTVQRYRLTDRVVLLSNDLSNADLSALYQRCQMVVYPSLYEGFGLPVLEALAHGAPVACSDSSSLPEVAGDSALYFNPRSAEDMARQMQRLVDTPGLRKELGCRGKIRAESFRWQLTAQRLHEIACDAVKKANLEVRCRPIT
ncbi:MAG: glycosyltransferase family 4 protein [candidate division WOR-3 bacterium]|nr:MAG: glycosyltransferase family 4 protein [candidate division WOR-3 bacterium]